MQRITRTVPFLHWEQIPCRFQGKYSHLLSVSLKVSAIVLAVVTQSEFLCRPSGLQEPNWLESTGFSLRFTHFTYCRKREFHVVGFWTSTSSRPEKLADTVRSVNTTCLQCQESRTVQLLGCPRWSLQLDSVVLMGPFQLQIVYHPVIMGFTVAGFISSF